jgi:selenocysteine-specific translation elongation factor
MKSLTVGVFHDDGIGALLGKKGTESDMVMYNRKTDGCIFTFMQPAGDRIAAKSQIMSAIDAAIISFSSMTPEVGETILMIDSFGISKGVAIVPPYTEMNNIVSVTKGTSLESFVIKERDPHKIIAALETIEPKRDEASPPAVVVDHSFSVRGVGEVALGFVRNGILRKHDKLMLMPAGKEVIVRSIQMQDKDFDEAPAGSRVGLAIKGATVDELRRGSVLCTPGSFKKAASIRLSFQKNRFYREGIRDGAFHATVGMQTFPVKVTGIKEGEVTIQTEKPVVYTPDDTFLLLDLNAKKVHIIGKGREAI